MKIVYSLFISLIFCALNTTAQDLRFSYEVVNPVYAQSKLIVYVQKLTPGTENIVGFNFGFFYQSAEATVQGYGAGATDNNILVGETTPFLDMSFAEDLGWSPAWNSGSIVTVSPPPPGLPSGYNRRFNGAIDDTNGAGALIGTTPVPIVAITLDNTIGGGPIHFDSTYQLGNDNDPAVTYFTGEEEFPVIILGPRLQPLPIELVSFSAKKYNERNSFLTWTTASEINSSHFFVQRSFDKKSWTTVGKVNAAGNSQFIQNYEYVDQNVYNGVDSRLSVYYRLLMIDLDGRTKNSPLENVVFGNDASTSGILAINVYPNPATDGVQVEWDATTDLQPTLLELYDVTGKLVMQQKVAKNANQEYIDFGPAKIQAGVYLLRILNGTEPIDHQQIVVGQSR